MWIAVLIALAVGITAAVLFLTLYSLWAGRGLFREARPPGTDVEILAGWWRRWVGYAIIDQIVVSAIWFATAFLISVAVYSGAEQWTKADEKNLANELAGLALFIWFLYFWVANSLGRSIGKLALGLRIVTTEHGTAPGLGRGLVRTIGYAVSTVPLALGFLWAASDQDRQAWHDKMACTIVINTRAIADYDKAIALGTPNDALAYANRAVAHATLGHFHQAIADSEKALSLTGDPRLTAEVQQFLEDLRNE